MYQLSILLPSGPKNGEKLTRILENLAATISEPNNVEIVICLDSVTGKEEARRIGNVVTCYANPSKYRSTFFEKAWENSTGRFVLMANDDMLFTTPGWDKLIPYDKYPDDLVMFYFKDNVFDRAFGCHPIWSRQVMAIDFTLLSPLYQITKCDNTIWDIHPPNRRIYLEDIVIKHEQEPYDLEIWGDAYEEDNVRYLEHTNQRNRVRSIITKVLKLDKHKVMIGIPTAEMGRKANFHDYAGAIDRPPNSVNVGVHSQSIAYNRNSIVKAAIQHNCTHVFFLDDDVIPHSDIIWKLLESDKDIVCALQLRRNFPHLPLVFGEKMDEMFNRRILQLHELKEGLNPIEASGLGAILIKTSVFKKLEEPWFRLGEFRKDQLQEDTGFFARLPKGIEIFCDTDVLVGHQASVTVRAVRRNDTWMVDYDTEGAGTVSYVPNRI